MNEGIIPQKRMSEINIQNLNKADVLAVLYNASKHVGRSFLHPYNQDPMTKQEAQILLSSKQSFDNIKGHILKIDLSGSILDTTLYNFYNGKGAAEKALKGLA
jgi:hypothetical protein